MKTAMIIQHLFPMGWIKPLGLVAMVLLAPSPTTSSAQVTYHATNQMLEAKMGVERVARYYLPAYASLASRYDDVRWVQIDLGQTRKIDGIKLLPGAQVWGPAAGGFPARFKLEIANDPDFKHPVLYEDFTLNEEYPNPDDVICSFASKTAQGRYVRLTATILRDNKLAMTKIMVLSDGQDIAEGCKTAESHPSKDSHVELLTRPPRPQGEFVVTDNPGNVMPVETWRPVAYQAQTPLGGVRLLDGLFKTTMENNISYLMNSFTFDQMARNFRLKAGLPVEPLEDRLKNMWFQILPGSEAARFLIGAGNTLRWIEDPDLRKRMDALVDLIDQCKEPDGYLMAFPKHRIFDFENGAYTRSWVTHGLIEAGYAGNPKAFPLLRNFHDWLDNCEFLPEMLRRVRQGPQGIIPFTRTFFSPAGKPQDIQVVQRYFQENYWMEGLAKRDPNSIWRYPYDRPHNYLVTAIEPYLDLYRATGARKYLDAALGGWELYHDHWRHIGGSLAINEGAFLYEPDSLLLRKETGELCGNAFWIKLNQRFLSLYPEIEKYAAEIEQSIYNVAIANQFGNQGIRYFAKLVDRKCVGNIPNTHHCMNTCCEGQGTRIFGSLPEFIYSTAEDGLFINLFAASEIKTSVYGQPVSLDMKTRFPYDAKVEIAVYHEQPLRYKLRVRVPSWASTNMPIRINGLDAAVGNPGTYLVLDRQWKNGDVISFTLPMVFKLTKYRGLEKGFEDHHYAIEYGPILMAMVDLKGNASDLGVNAGPETIPNRLKPVPGKPLRFSLEGHSAFEYRPYFEVQDEPFSCFPRFQP